MRSDATDEDIRREYKRLAKANHPDLNPDPGASLRMKALNEAYRVLGDPSRRAAYDTLAGVRRWVHDEVFGEPPPTRGLKRFEMELDNELSIQENLIRKRAARELLVRKTDYRLYYVSSQDHRSWHRVSADSGCRCPDAQGVAGPFGCKHWFAMEAFRNNADRPVDWNAPRQAGGIRR
ncbi:MAG: DnaJ domain-containing protein [Chloroflexi bacterium]|nr:DnaJ domain-containing protein [Chloroflexota bacterium]